MKERKKKIPSSFEKFQGPKEAIKCDWNTCLLPWLHVLVPNFKTTRKPVLKLEFRPYLALILCNKIRSLKPHLQTWKTGIKIEESSRDQGCSAKLVGWRQMARRVTERNNISLLSLLTQAKIWIQKNIYIYNTKKI